VVNYPLDGKGKGFEKGITDDDELFRHISSYVIIFFSEF
jgi:hypothetical protein